jgi:hypothetical protein
MIGSRERQRHQRLAQELIGKVVDDAKLQSDGRNQQSAGKIQNAVGGLTPCGR